MSSLKETGSFLDGKYEVLEHLGEGGEGEVYLVRHIHLEENRVIKILRADRVGDPSAQRRFLREARFATQIKNAHVAVLYDYSRLDNGSFYMVWEHIEGHHVGEHLSSSGALPVPLALDLAIQCLTGLAAIHAAGIIHRDISPDNLMVFQAADGSHRVKIIDLGLAKDLEPDPEMEVTQAGMFMGKLKYCAPEQAGMVKGETIDHRADLYSFALVLYEMVSGKPPFEAETPQGAVFKRLSEDPMPMHERVPGLAVPQQLEEVILKGLARQREDRFSDASEFIAALAQVRKGLDAAATKEIAKPVVETQRRSRAAPTERTASGLSRAERIDLLAQIDRAARRMHESSKVISQAEALFGAGRLSEASDLLGKLESIHPAASGLASLKARIGRTNSDAELASNEEQRAQKVEDFVSRGRRALAENRWIEAQEAIDHASELDSEDKDLVVLKAHLAERKRVKAHEARVLEAEEMVSSYLQKKQPQLARLALETLGELVPDHPQLGEFSSWIKLLGVEVEQEQRAAGLLEDARAAIRYGNRRIAKRRLAALRKVDRDQADLLASEIDQMDANRLADQVFEQHRERFDRALADGDLDTAQAELIEVGRLDVARVTVDLMRSSLDEVRSRAHQDAQVSAFFETFQERLEAMDWLAARDVAREFQALYPDHPRANRLLGEVDELSIVDGKRRAIEAGIEQVQGFIRTGEVDQAELALKVLTQMTPDHPLRPELEQAVAGLRD